MKYEMALSKMRKGKALRVGTHVFFHTMINGKLLHGMDEADTLYPTESMTGEEITSLNWRVDRKISRALSYRRKKALEATE